MNFIQEYFDFSKLFDGMLLALGVLAVWLLAILGASLIRGLGNAGGNGFMFLGKYVLGKHQYGKGDLSNIVNVTLNTTRNGVLSIDTIVADKTLMDVWQNVYHVFRLKAAMKRCTQDNPVIHFPSRESGNGKKYRDEYRATYDPLISLIAERCTNDGSIDLCLGRHMVEHRFVIALTFEQLNDLRSQHFRVMMIAERELISLPAHTDVEREEHHNRFRTLQSIARQYKASPQRFGIVKVWRPCL